MERGWRGDSGDHPVGDLCIVALGLGEKVQGRFEACGAALCFQAQTNNAVKGEHPLQLGSGVELYRRNATILLLLLPKPFISDLSCSNVQ